MLICFFNSEALVGTYELSFSYRYSVAYHRGLRARLQKPIREIPLALPEVEGFTAYISRVKPAIVRKLLSLVVQLILKYLFFLYDIFRLYLLLLRVKPDILHINNGGYPAAFSCLAAVFAAKLARIKRVVFVVNNVAVPYDSWPRVINKPIDRFVARNTTVFVTGSRYAGRKLSEVLHLEEGKVINIPNTVMARPITEPKESVRASLALTSEDVVIGTVGLLEERKGHQYLIEAFAKLRDAYEGFPKLKLIIEGKGTEAERLKRLVQFHNLDERVFFFHDTQNIFSLMNIFDIFIISSIANEDFPNVVLEAMSLGKPIIGTRLAGISEQIAHMENGLLVQAKDVAALAEAILMLVKDNDKRLDMGKRSLQRFNELFSYDQVITMYRQLYEDLQHNRQPSGRLGVEQTE
jgi:glycosyltransferase involved in cell wall biosynthesis